MTKKIQLTEKQLFNVLKYSLLNEVRYIDAPNSRRFSFDKVSPKNHLERYTNQEPIKNNERIRVFHGTDMKTAIKIAKEGLSGEEIKPRNYSYENRMNPSGLFVSTDFYDAKEFGYVYDDMVILEFTVKVSDLDTPVWNNQDSYFGQNTNPQGFNNRSERVSQRLHYEHNAEESENDYVKNSDNKALADRIFNYSEHQALFYGNLNPNMIKRFWVKEMGKGGVPKTKNYIPLTYKEFIKKYGEKEYKMSNGTSQTVYSNKVCKPNDNLDIYGMAEAILNDWANSNSKIKQNRASRKEIEEVAQQLQEYADSLKGYTDDNDYKKMSIRSTLKDMFFPKQIINLIGFDAYKEWFNDFYPQNFNQTHNF